MAPLTAATVSAYEASLRNALPSLLVLIPKGDFPQDGTRLLFGGEHRRRDPAVAHVGITQSGLLRCV
jgi:hypothetical protein